MLILALLLTLVAQNECSYKGRVQIETDVIRVKFRSGPREHTLSPSSFGTAKPQGCSTDDGSYCLEWGDAAWFSIRSVGGNCDVYEMKTKLDVTLTVTFDVSAVALYGGTESFMQTWPVQRTELDSVAFVSSESNGQSVLESYWLDSNGSYVYVDPTVPLFVTQNERVLRLAARRQSPYVRQGHFTVMKYRLCTFEHVRAAHQDAVDHALGRPERTPDFEMVRHPIWSTWAEYKADINESTVLEFADAIVGHGFVRNSQLEIDDMWETCYGSMTIDPKRFPDMRRLVGDLRRKGFRVTLWIHPFVNTNCEPHFTAAKKAGYFVRSTNGSVDISWWNGAGAYVDFTNPAAVSWFQERLRRLQRETGLDSFKFDGGENSWMPQPAVFHRMGDDQPDAQIPAYVRMAAVFGDMIETRVARRTQKAGVYVRMMDRGTTWTGPLGLQTLIPETLHMNVVGYPYVMPDMIGGNGYGGDAVTEEMFVRWLQISTFMPVLQFSLAPWKLSAKTVDITKRYINLHTRYADTIGKLMVEATVSGAPVNRPLWWIDPADQVALTMGSEYLLGDDILVAPIVEKGAVSRDIYLPGGCWKDENRNGSGCIEGPVWLKNYPADLETLPYFLRVPNDASRVLPTFIFIAAVLVFLFSKCNSITVC